MVVDYSLYLVTDRSFLKGVSLKDAVEQAIKGGVTMVQIREKELSTREFYRTALEVKEITDKYNVPLIINDRIDVALAINADGIHLGQSDMPIAIARKLLGNDKIIGISAESLEEAEEAQRAGADYLGIGAVFFTGSKKDINVPIELEGLKKICDSISIPSVAIGGINETNIKDVLQTGTNGAAVISAILGKENIELAARELKNLMN